jgi:hypothetical protein
MVGEERVMRARKRSVRIRDAMLAVRELKYGGFAKVFQG